MEQLVVHWEMMGYFPMKTHVVSHVTLVIGKLVAFSEHVNLMVVGVDYQRPVPSWSVPHHLYQ